MSEETIDQIKEIFLKDEEFQTKLAFLSDNSSQIKIVAESIGKESQEALVECFLVIADILSQQPIKPDLRCAVEYVQSLSNASNNKILQ